MEIIRTSKEEKSSWLWSSSMSRAGEGKKELKKQNRINYARGACVTSCDFNGAVREGTRSNEHVSGKFHFWWNFWFKSPDMIEARAMFFLEVNFRNNLRSELKFSGRWSFPMRWNRKSAQRAAGASGNNYVRLCNHLEISTNFDVVNSAEKYLLRQKYSASVECGKMEWMTRWVFNQSSAKTSTFAYFRPSL